MHAGGLNYSYYVTHKGFLDVPHKTSIHADAIPICSSVCTIIPQGAVEACVARQCHIVKGGRDGKSAKTSATRNCLV